MKTALFDAHCDTAFELFRKGERLKQNSGHIDLQRVGEYVHYAQIFAFCSLSGLKNLPWTAEELLQKPCCLLSQDLQELLKYL